MIERLEKHPLFAHVDHYIDDDRVVVCLCLLPEFALFSCEQALLERLGLAFSEGRNFETQLITGRCDMPTLREVLEVLDAFYVVARIERDV